MKKVLNKDILKKFLIIFVLLQPILDTYILFEQKAIDIFKMSPSTIIRLIFVLVIAIYSLFVLDLKKERKHYLGYVIVVVLYSIFHLYSVSNFKTLIPDNLNYSNFSEIFYLIRLLIPVFLTIVFSKIDFNKKEIRNIFCILFFMISGTIVITNLLKISMGSYVTEKIKFNIIEWFTKNVHDTYSFYDTASRGFFSFANMISSVLFGFCCILFYRLYKECNLKNIIFLIIQMCAMFMLGTKIATFGYLLSLIAMFLVYTFFCLKKEMNFKLNNLIISILLISLWFCIYPFSPCKNRSGIDVDNAIKNENNSSNIIENPNDYFETNEEKESYIKDYLCNNYKNFSIKEDYILRYYPYQYDYMYWYNMLNESYLIKTDNRLLTISILNRMKEIDDRKLTDDLFGVSYSRMSNMVVLEKDFVSQYYSLGILGVILFVGPLVILPTLCFVRIVKYRNLNFYNISMIIGLFSSLAGAYFCGNTLDNLTFSIMYSFFLGILINDTYKKNEKKINNNKISIYALHLGYGGVEKYISSLCKMLEDNYEIEVISTYKVLDKPAFDFSDKVKITYLIDDKPNKDEFKIALKSKNIIGVIKEGFKAVRLLYLRKERNINSIKSNDSKYIITTRILHNKLVSIYSGDDVVKIATEHNYHNDNKKYINDLVNSIKNFDYFVVVSITLMDFYKDKIGNTKCLYIPNVIDEMPIRSSSLKNNNLINVGRIEKEKDQESLIEVFKLVKEKVSDAKLYIIGDGSLKENLEKKVKEYNLSDSVIFTGFLNKDEIEEYLVNSKLFVLTSLTESFGLVLIEAMSYKVPCIAFDTSSGAKNLLKDGNGILIKDRDNNKMAEEIVKLLNDDNKLKKVSNKGYNSCKRYLLANVKKEWLELLKK